MTIPQVGILNWLISGLNLTRVIHAIFSQLCLDAAQVDEVECTKVITKYVHPENPCIVLWDIPGGGTTTHTAATYFMDKKLYAFDMIIIIGAAGFKELDIAIAKGAKEFNVSPF